MHNLVLSVTRQFTWIRINCVQTHFFTHRAFLHKHMFTWVEFDSQHTSLRSIVCHVKLSSLCIVEDLIKVAQTTQSWSSCCSFVLDLNHTRSTLPIKNLEVLGFPITNTIGFLLQVQTLCWSNRISFVLCVVTSVDSRSILSLSSNF